MREFRNNCVIMAGYRIRLGLGTMAGAVLAYYWNARRRDMSPQRAWLEDAVLTVENGGGKGSCDLSMARQIRLRETVSLRGDPSFHVMVARDTPSARKVRLILRSDEGTSFRAEDLLLLAAAIESSPRSAQADADAKAVAGTLRELARYGRKKTWSDSVDWSHRTGQ